MRGLRALQSGQLDDTVKLLHGVPDTGERPAGQVDDIGRELLVEAVESGRALRVGDGGVTVEDAPLLRLNHLAELGFRLLCFDVRVGSSACSKLLLGI